MKVAIKNIGLLLVVCLLAILPTVGIAAGAVENEEAEPDKGPNNGLMLREEVLWWSWLSLRPECRQSIAPG